MSEKKKRKKSLVGWSYMNWFLGWYGTDLMRDPLVMRTQKSLLGVVESPNKRKTVKVRITIEEI